MKITNLDLITSIAPLSILGNLHLPVQTSFRLGQVMRATMSANGDYENARLKLVAQFSKKDEGGKTVEILDHASGKTVAEFEDRAGFDAALKILQAIEVDIPGDQFKVSDLGPVNMPANVLSAVHWLIVA